MVLESRSILVTVAMVGLFAGACEGQRAGKTDIDPIIEGSGGETSVAPGSGGTGGDVVVPGSGGIENAGSGGTASDGSGGEVAVSGSGGIDNAGSGGTAFDGSGGTGGEVAVSGSGGAAGDATDAGVVDSAAIDGPADDVAVADGGVTVDSGTGDVRAPFDGPSATCIPGTAQCNNCIDDDGDGKTDSADPECTGQIDNDESSYATGIPGDNMDDGTSCRQDCFFDGNSGQGDDCSWDLRCDPLRVETARCAYNSSACVAQSDSCVSGCLDRVPNGCDCFGCCLVAGTTRAVRLTKSCTEKDLGDPAKCPACTQDPSCVNTCDHCEVCVGKNAPEPDCFAGADAGTSLDAGSISDDGDSETPGNCGDQVYCGPGSAGLCPEGSYCVTGCCMQSVP